MKKFLLTLVLVTSLATQAFAQSAKQEIDRFAAFYASQVAATGFKPDHTSTRDSRIAFLQSTVKKFCSPLLSMKRASPSRPISDEVVVFVRTREFRDFLGNGGSPNWAVITNAEPEVLPSDQPLVNPLTLGEFSGNVVPLDPSCGTTGPVDPTPTPQPQPTPPADLSPVLARLAAIESALAKLESSLGDTIRSVDEGVRGVAGRLETNISLSDRLLRQLNSPPDYTGRVLGTPLTLRPVVKPVSP